MNAAQNRTISMPREEIQQFAVKDAVTGSEPAVGAILRAAGIQNTVETVEFFIQFGFRYR